MRIEVVTLFPDLIEAGALGRRAGTRGDDRKLAVGLENPRSHADDLHRTVDDRPYGGGPGMVLKAEPLAKAIERRESALAGGCADDRARRAGRAVRPGDGGKAREPAGIRAGGGTVRRDRRAGRRTR